MNNIIVWSADKRISGFVFFAFQYQKKIINELSKVDMYRDVIPLSEVEIRWIKTIVEDEKIHYFLSEKEIISIKLLLAEMAIDIRPFPMDVVKGLRDETPTC